MRTSLFVSASFATLLAALPAHAQKEVQWWHAMGGNLGETVNQLAAEFNKSQTAFKVVPVYKGSYTETLTAAIKKAFNIEKMNDVVFTASSENKVEFLKDHKLKIYYGDADSDMKAAIAADIRPIRVMRAQNSTYKPEPKNGKFGEEVIVDSTN